MAFTCFYGPQIIATASDLIRAVLPKNPSGDKLRFLRSKHCSKIPCCQSSTTQ
ncbi:hypothetical protein ALP36_102890 [Pseudomonas syringae pv. coriandricola]|uniref:Uncharacterized protein n=1 Tax=Pseudomonas syringae pv. coriandricola TaxID=264453 RepID=A0A3M5RMF8_9PSED|nr:hypothetical protein ALO84_102323 [Pseudomonas syringae pv. maculicola]RMU10183.1 hypothetical protein ALP36_102890 [Pseudomonas syringae pv. coriandricola]